MTDDLPVLRAIDEAMGWVEPDGSSPATVAADHGHTAVIIGQDGPMPEVAWGNLATGVWACGPYDPPYLARSPGFLSYLKGLNLSREQRKALHSRRYLRWCCTKKPDCECQHHRIARGCAKGCYCHKCKTCKGECGNCYNCKHPVKTCENPCTTDR